jgi:hypothetical protein
MQSSGGHQDAVWDPINDYRQLVMQQLMINQALDNMCDRGHRIPDGRGPVPTAEQTVEATSEPDA